MIRSIVAVHSRERRGGSGDERLADETELEEHSAFQRRPFARYRTLQQPTHLPLRLFRQPMFEEIER
jgi:hypothetical protein